MAKKVRIYSTPSCTFCHAAKEFFKEHKVKYEEIDVSKDQNAAKEMIEKSGQMGVPVIDINGKITIGFNQEKLKKELGIK